jgi:hypothetical protein
MKKNRLNELKNLSLIELDIIYRFINEGGLNGYSTEYLDVESDGGLYERWEKLLVNRNNLLNDIKDIIREKVQNYVGDEPDVEELDE